jgi:hypothetical protein
MRPAMRTAISQRDERLARTRRLSLWVAGGACAASVGLAGLLGTARPGHTLAPGRHAAGGAAGTGAEGSRDSGNAGGSGAGEGQGAGQHHGAGSQRRARGLTPPSRSPSGSGGAPVTSSGGS